MTYYVLESLCVFKTKTLIFSGPLPKDFTYRGSPSNPSSPIPVKELDSPDLTPPPTPEPFQRSSLNNGMFNLHHYFLRYVCLSFHGSGIRCMSVALQRFISSRAVDASCTHCHIYEVPPNENFLLNFSICLFTKIPNYLFYNKFVNFRMGIRSSLTNHS